MKKIKGAEQGFALIGVLLMLILLSGLVASLTISGQTETKISQNYEGEAIARAAAEAGLNHATEVVIAKLSTWQADGFANPSAAISAMLKGPDGLTGTAATNADNGSLELLGTDAAQRIPRSPAVRTIGLNETYEARVFDEDDPARGTTLAAADVARINEDNLIFNDKNKQVVVRAIGHGPNNTQVVLEAIIGYGVGDPAILVNGDLEIKGNVQVNGAFGSVHSNGDMDISGSPDISMDATATGTYSVTGNPTVGGASGGGYAPLATPDIHASDHLAQATWIMKTDGTITNQAGVVQCAAAACGAWGGWSHSAGWWTVNGNTIKPGTYYSSGGDSIKISGNPGPASVSLISTGSIDISGDPNFSANTPGLLLLSDGDMQITGNMTQTGAEAQVLVREQISIAGNPSLLGQIMVQNVPSVYSLVTGNKVDTFFGSFSLTYSGGLGGGTGAPTVTGWRQQ